MRHDFAEAIWGSQTKSTDQETLCSGSIYVCQCHGCGLAEESGLSTPCAQILACAKKALYPPQGGMAKPKTMVLVFGFSE